MTEITQAVPSTEQNLDFIDIEEWLKNILQNHTSKNPYILRQALILAQLAGEDKKTPTEESCLKQGMMMGEIINSLKVDDDTLAAAILYSTAQYTDLKAEDIADHLGEKISKLISDTKQMASISDLYQAIYIRDQKSHNIDNIRKMLLAMVDDIRVVLIKLAERLCILRRASILDEQKRLEIAKETLAIYAPLTNRLGITQIKLEMEDLAFSYLEPAAYQKIANYLKQNRLEREQFIKETIAEMENALKQANIQNFQVTGRAKHIYSIYKKMQRKHVDIQEIYDVSAIRVLVSSVQDCYAVLSIVHSIWQQIPREFDDYIAMPKPNGYRSIHTAVLGPNGKNLEIQIRTYEMHEIAELGVAAHWVYKEGATTKTNYEAKIAWLRQVMDWQEEITANEDELKEVRQIFRDRIYVFTPAGDILDLPTGATPLDFAYAVHSGLGHRCRGAKVNGNIVPLTYQMKTGDHVDILKGKNPAPSRDWLSPTLGFLKTSRAKAKVLHWFKELDHEQYISSTKPVETELPQNIIKPKVRVKTHKKLNDIKIQGVDNLLTNIARCCKPVPGETIVGYITQGRGISIHRKNCHNILEALKIHPEKILNVSWNDQSEARYPINLIVAAYDRAGLVRDISNVIANENLMIRDLNFSSDKKANLAYVNLTIEIANINSLNAILAKINKIPNVIEISRH